MVIRLAKGKEDLKRFKERYGYASAKRPEGKLTWFHVASVGEVNSVIKLLKLLVEQNSDKSSFLLTVGSKTGIATAEKKLKDTNIIVQYAPIDQYFAVKRFIKYWKPNLVFLTESEIWPNIVTLSSQYGGKLVIINGKMSSKSLQKWLKNPKFKNEIFSCFYLCFPQTEESTENFKKLGIRKTKYLGNLKFDAAIQKPDSTEVKNLKMQIGRRPIWLAASTHRGEEEIIAQIHTELKKKHSDILTIIAIRHPKRSKEVLSLLKKQFKLKVAVRSRGDKIKKNIDIYLFDTLGEMSTIFSTSNIVMMCGSFVDDIGGHTPVEPAQLNSAILTAPYISNNKALFEELEKRNACRVLKTTNISEAVNAIELLLEHPHEVELLQKNASETIKEFKGLTLKIAKEIENNFYSSWSKKNKK